MSEKFGDRTCRSCLRDTEELCPLFNPEQSPSFGSMLQSCAQIDVYENDGLPSVICISCTREMQQACEFIKKCKNSDEILRRFIKTELKEDLANLSSDLANDSDVKDEISNLYIPLLDPDPEDDHETKSNIMSKKKSDNLSKQKKYLPDLKRNAKSSAIKCQVCGLIAQSKSAMIIHNRSHTNERPFQCSNCDKCFKDKGTLKGHIIRFHSNVGRQFTCDYCGKMFYRKKELVCHLRTHSGDTPYSCPHCDKSFSQLSNTISHIRSHTGEKPYPCNICPKRFKTSYHCRVHMIVHSEERKFKCFVCGISVKTQKSLINHQLVHTDRTPHICEQCGMAYSTKGNLRAHLKTVHSQESGTCSICNKRFSKLKEHLRSHTGEKPFQCQHCNKCFSKQSRLTAHITRHKNINKFSCDIDNCLKTFPIKSMLEYHILKFHKHQKPFVCSLCKRGFYRLCDLKLHQFKSHKNLTQNTINNLKDSKSN